MKKLVIASLLLIGVYAGKCHGAAGLVAETPVKAVGTPVTVAISSTTLTKVPTSQTSGRFGIYVSLPVTAGSGVVGFFGDCTSTALASTIRPIELSTGTARGGFDYFSMREDICLWLLSLNTAAATQDIHYQEVKQ